VSTASVVAGALPLDAFRFEAQKLRLIEAFTYPHDAAAKGVNAERMREPRASASLFE
jgi:hypothetical protein